MTDAINNAVSFGRGDNGCVVVASSGNWDHNLATFHKYMKCPAVLPNVITVGAVSPCGERKSLISCDGEYF